MSRLASALVFGFILVAASCVNDAGNEDSPTIAEYSSGGEFSAGHFSYGEDVNDEQIAGWNIDVRPDGLGLPPGSATAEDGEMLYEDQCASCHGSFGEGVGRYPVLAGGEGTLTEARPEKTVGSFWPYASTLWDYIHRAMPFAQPESLSDDEVYAVTAYVLYLNDLVEYDFELTQDNLAQIEMPNKDGFFLDDRPDVIAVRCMENCKDPNSIEITSEPAAAEVETDVAETDVAETTIESVATNGQTIYQQACAMCHVSGLADAPIPGDMAGWAERLPLGRDVLVASVLDGKGVMPPKGGQLQLTDDDIGDAVDYMLSQLAE